MKKLSFGIITSMLLLTIMLPLTVDAATLTTQTTEMKVGQTVEIEVTADNEVESIQFDLQYDSSKYEYVVDSATTDGKLEATDSNYMATDRIRVSAFDLNGGKAKTVKMKFKAIAAGESVPFNIVGLTEIGENGETFRDPKLTVKQIVGGKEVEEATSTQYVDSKGNAILQLPQTGEQDAIQIYGDLVVGKNIVAYALPYSDDTVSIESVKQQFGNEIVVNDSDNNGILGTGETFTLNGENYTILIYGDVNGDGKVTTLDALATRKADTGKITVGTVESEALDVVKDTSKDNDDKANALAAQAFILRKQYNTQKNSIIDVFPNEVKDVINEIDGAKTPGKTFRYEDITLAMVSSKNNVNIEEKMLTYEVKYEGAIVGKDIAEVSYSNSATGVYEMKLYATRTGDYEVTPIVVGVDVEGGVVRGEAIPITITDSTAISEIEITDIEGNVIPENEKITVNKGKEKEFKVNFKHTYYKKDGTVAETINLTNVASNVATIANNNSCLESATWEGNPITGMKLKAGIPSAGTNLPVSGTIKITADNSTYGVANKEREIQVEVAEAKITGIDFNGTQLSNNLTTVNKAINLYKDTNVISSESNDTETIGGTLFTIVPIQLRDEEGDTSSIVKGNIVEGKENDSGYEGKVVIYETGDVEYRSTYDLQILYFKKENGAYIEKAKATDEVDYIGIALTTKAAGSLNDIDEDTGKTPLETLKEGLTIEYDTISGRKSAQVSLDGIYENGNNLFNEETGISLLSEDEIEADKTVEPEVVAVEQQKETTTEKKEIEKVETKKEEVKNPEVEKDEDSDDTTIKVEGEDKVEEDDKKQEVETPGAPVEPQEPEEVVVE